MSFSSLTGSEYDQCSKNIMLYVSKITQSYIKPKKATYKKLLEIGCGTGGITDFYVKYFKPESFLGIDVIDHYLEFARDRAYEASIDIKYEKCDLNNVEELTEILKKNPDIDIVVSSFVLHWVDDPIELFQTISSNLNPGVEHFHISVTGLQEELLDLVQIYETHPTWKVYYENICKIPPLLAREETMYPSKDFFRSILDQNFEVYEERLIAVNNQFESAEMAELFFKFLLPFTDFIPYHFQEDFIKEFMTDSKEACQNNDVWKYNLYLLHAKN